MTTRRKQLLIAALVVLPTIGIIWFCIFGDGYHAELWLKRFDQSVWLENKTEGLYSPRRPMVKSVMRHLKLGMARQEVEKLLGPPIARGGVGRHTTLVFRAGRHSL